MNFKEVRWNALGLISNWASSWNMPPSTIQLFYRKGLSNREISMPPDDAQCTPPIFPYREKPQRKNKLVHYWKSCSRSFPFPLFCLSCWIHYFWPRPFHSANIYKLSASTVHSTENTGNNRFNSYFQAIVEAVIVYIFKMCYRRKEENE